MTLMMSDSLKDIVSIGQLTGEETDLTINFDGDVINLNIFSIIKDESHVRVLAYAGRDLVLRALTSNAVTAKAVFAGTTVQNGPVTCVGLVPTTIGDEIHDMLIVHIKRDNE